MSVYYWDWTNPETGEAWGYDLHVWMYWYHIGKIGKGSK